MIFLLVTGFSTFSLEELLGTVDKLNTELVPEVLRQCKITYQPTGSVEVSGVYKTAKTEKPKQVFSFLHLLQQKVEKILQVLLLSDTTALDLQKIS